MTIDPDDTFGKLELEFELYGDRLEANVQIAMEAAANMLLSLLISFTPIDTGMTAASWAVIPGDWHEFYVTNSNTPVIDYLTEGTSAHQVLPVIAKALHWIDEVSGGDRFSKGHWVKGIMPIPIEEMALDELDPILDQLLDAAEENAWNEGFPD
jgi:hypothetical protein